MHSTPMSDNFVRQYTPPTNGNKSASRFTLALSNQEDTFESTKPTHSSISSQSPPGFVTLLRVLPSMLFGKRPSVLVNKKEAEAAAQVHIHQLPPAADYNVFAPGALEDRINHVGPMAVFPEDEVQQNESAYSIRQLITLMAQKEPLADRDIRSVVREHDLPHHLRFDDVGLTTDQIIARVPEDAIPEADRAQHELFIRKALERAWRAGLIYKMTRFDEYDISRGTTYYGVSEEVRHAMNLKPQVNTPIVTIGTEAGQFAAGSPKDTFFKELAALLSTVNTQLLNSPNDRSKLYNDDETLMYFAELAQLLYDEQPSYLDEKIIPPGISQFIEQQPPLNTTSISSALINATAMAIDYFPDDKVGETLLNLCSLGVQAGEVDPDGFQYESWASEVTAA